MVIFLWKHIGAEANIWAFFQYIKEGWVGGSSGNGWVGYFFFGGGSAPPPLKQKPGGVRLIYGKVGCRLEVQDLEMGDRQELKICMCVIPAKKIYDIEPLHSTFLY